MSTVLDRGPAMARRSGDVLTGVMSYKANGKDPKPRTWRRPEFSPDLAAWFDAAADGDEAEVIAEMDGEGRLVRVRLARPPVVLVPAADRARLDLVRQRGGGVNPYTFIPTPPREGLPPGLGDGPPGPHGVIDCDDQWSGWLALRFVTRTPLLLPDPEKATCDAEDHATYPVRLAADGRPLLHGASVKGALRSAYETVTDSRYGVFRGHERALAYRRPASKQDRVDVTPARVESDGKGGLRFRLCKSPLPVPVYDQPEDGQGRRRHLARAAGAALRLITRDDGTLDWSRLHGREVTFTTRTITRPPRPGQARGSTRDVVDKVWLAGEGGRDGKRGWLSVTGRSIGIKTSERLFVPTQEVIPVEERHHEFWQAVLASYRDAAVSGEPGLDGAGQKLDPSRHVLPAGAEPARLQEGDLVYLDVTRPAAQQRQGPSRGGGRAAGPGSGRGPGGGRGRGAGAVTGVHPVMIGRLPYGRSPAQALHESLHPAAVLGDLSPADRVFGWVPAGAGEGRRSSSGYRGRLRVDSVTCETDDWLVDHGEAGVTLAPLSSPKPTQFRFYTAADEAGTPVPRRAPKGDGYDGGLRGRKAYWYPSPVPDGYWTPGDGRVGGRFREWQEPPEAKRSQTSTHLGWVREGTEFVVRLFVDAVPGAELGPLVWLATQEGCALRLGAGKPLGFGAVATSVDWERTELRTGAALRGCWLSLDRPDPAGRADIEALAAAFGEAAASNPVLAPAVEAWRKVAKGIDEPIHYPRTQRAPEAETYRWFVANEHIEGGGAEYGFALPHVLEADQRLPLLPPRHDS